MKINAIHKYTYLLLLSLFATETIQAQMKAYAEYVFNTNIPLSCNDPGGKVKVTVTGGTAPYTYTWSTGETTYSNSSPVTVTTTGTVTTTTTMLNVQTYGKYTCTVSDYNNNVITSSERPQIVVIFDTIVNNTGIDLIRNKFNAVELEVSPISKARLWEIPLTSFPFYITDSGFTYTINNIGDAVDRVKNQPGVGASGLNHDIGQPDALGGACSFGIDSQNGDNLTPLCPSGIEDITASCSNPVKITILDSKINLTRSNILSRYNDTISNTTPIPDFCPTLHGDRVASVIQRLVASDSSIQILPITVLNSYGMGTVFDVIKGVDYANVQGAKILNMSFIGTDLIDESLSNSPLKVAIDLLKTNNALAIKAAGNNGINFSQVETKTKTFIRNGLPETKTSLAVSRNVISGSLHKSPFCS